MTAVNFSYIFGGLCETFSQTPRIIFDELFQLLVISLGGGSGGDA